MSSWVTEITLGGNVLGNTGDEPATLREVTLFEARQMTLIDAVLVSMPAVGPDGKYTLIGVSAEYPPTAPEAQDRWRARVPAVGAVLPPGEERNFVVGLRAEPGARSPSMEAVIVTYELPSGDRFEARTSTAVQVDCPPSQAPSP
jgi:hypothetical protein